MAHKVVKYRLESDGTIPTWLKFGVSQSTGGMYPVADSGTASPRDMIMIGISCFVVVMYILLFIVFAKFLYRTRKTWTLGLWK